MERIGHHDVDVAVEPAKLDEVGFLSIGWNVGIDGIIDTNREFVGAGFQRFGDVEVERIVAGVRVFADGSAIDPEFGGLHGTLEFEEDLFPLPGIRHGKRAAIPSHLAAVLGETAEIRGKHLVGVGQ